MLSRLLLVCLGWWAVEWVKRWRRVARSRQEIRNRQAAYRAMRDRE